MTDLMMAGSPVLNEQNLDQLIVIQQIREYLDKIYYIQAESPYCRVFFDLQQKRQIELRVTIQALDEAFSSLIRVHRSYLVHQRKIKTFKRKSPADYELIFISNSKDKVSIPAGRTYISKLRTDYPELF